MGRVAGNAPGSGDAGPHAVVAVGATVDFGYDDNGNRVSKDDDGSVTVYAYSPENRLESVDLPSDGDDVTMVYDASGTRVSRSHGGLSTTYVGGVLEIDRTGETVTASRRLYRFGGVGVAVGDGDGVSFLFQDRLGSTVAAFDTATDTAAGLYYFPYGGERDAVGSVGVDQRYTGQTSDIEAASAGTGLVYYQARYYDPQVGAFTAADTLIPTVGLSAGLNRYAYVSDNPTNNTDPTGNSTIQLTPFLTGDSKNIGDGTVTVAGVKVQFMSPSADAPQGNPQLPFWDLYNAMYRRKGLEWADGEAALDALEGPALVGSTFSRSRNPALRRIGNAASRLSGTLTAIDVLRDCASASDTCGESGSNAVLSTVLARSTSIAANGGAGLVMFIASDFLLSWTYPDLDGGGYSTPVQEWFWGGAGGYPIRGQGGGLGGWHR